MNIAGREIGPGNPVFIVCDISCSHEGSLDKAKELTKRRLRAEREPLLAAQDVAFQRALETGDNVADIVAEKARLRDITNLTDGCTTTAELRALTCAK